MTDTVPSTADTVPATADTVPATADTVPATADAVRPWARRAQASAAAFIGAVVMAVGLGVAVSYVRVTGWSLSSISGVLALVGGAALFVFGVVDGLRTMRRRWWALVVPVGLMMTYAVVRPTAIAVAATRVPRAPLETVDLTALGDVTDVSFAASDGVRLDAWWVAPTNAAAVVVQPGASSARSAVVDEAAVLLRNGYGVLLVDRGAWVPATARP